MKRLTIILITLASLSAISCSIASVIAAKRADTIRQQAETIERQGEALAALTAYNKELAEINGISVEVVFNLKQNNVFSVSNNNIQNIAREISQYTRAELLDSLRADKNKHIQDGTFQQKKD